MQELPLPHYHRTIVEDMNERGKVRVTASNVSAVDVLVDRGYAIRRNGFAYPTRKATEGPIGSE